MTLHICNMLRCQFEFIMYKPHLRRMPGKKQLAYVHFPHIPNRDFVRILYFRCHSSGHFSHSFSMLLFISAHYSRHFKNILYPIVLTIPGSLLPTSLLLSVDLRSPLSRICLIDWRVASMIIFAYACLLKPEEGSRGFLDNSV